MSASPFLSHAITSFPCNPTKIPTPFISCRSSKYSIITVCSSPTNGSNSPKTEGRNIEYESKDTCIKSSESISHSRSSIKAPTAPWMNEPLLVKPSEMESMKPRTKKGSSSGRNKKHPDVDLTGKVGGGRGRLAMKKVLRGIENLQEMHNLEEISKTLENKKFKFAPGVLWGNGDYESNVKGEEDHEVVQEKLESDEFDVPLSKVEREVKLNRFPWKRDGKMIIRRVKKEKLVTAAELSLDGVLLERLRDEAALIRKWVKVMKAGATQAVVDQVHFTWRNSELALLKFDIPLSHNMDRAREIIEMKTGGLVVWRNKVFLAVYRGCNYDSDSKYFRRMHKNSASDQGNSSSTMNYRNVTYVAPANSDRSGPDQMIHEKDDKGESLHMASLYEREADRLLDGLGPRFVDWWMHKPLPVDGDLLPELVPGYKTPFRLSPPFTRSKLTDAELTYLRKLARPLPTHFVLETGIFKDWLQLL